MSNVDNRFEQPTSGTDNRLVLGGTVNTAGGQSIKNIIITVKLDDVSTAGQIYVASPVAGTIRKIYSVINGAIATADAVLTPKIGGTPITDGAITITQSGSAAGDVDSSTPSAANVVSAGDAIEIETNGASTNTVEAAISILIELS